MVEMLREGSAQGFHVNYFYKGHGPTDFDRWAAAASEDTATGKHETRNGGNPLDGLKSRLTRC